MTNLRSGGPGSPGPLLDRWMLIRASDRLLEAIEVERLCGMSDGDPLPPGWIRYYREVLGGSRARFKGITDFHNSVFSFQGGLLKGGYDEEPQRRRRRPVKPVDQAIAPPIVSTPVVRLPPVGLRRKARRQGIALPSVEEFDARIESLQLRPRV